jgi:hypothetical protein
LEKGTGTFFTSLFLLLLCHSAIAAVRLPLDGYCQPGRFFPVALDRADASASITLAADGCVPTQIQSTGQGSRIVPMLCYGDPHELRWPGGSVPLRTISSNERLVGTTTTDLPGDLFPNARLIPIHLDPADPLPGPPSAWESLDAIVLDSATFARVDDAHRSTLLAGGSTLTAIGDRPTDHWPWQKRGSYWLLRANIAGPVDDVIDDAVYAPTFAWQPGWPARVRRQVFGTAAALLILILGIVLIGRGSRASAIAAIALCLISAGLVIAWRDSLGSTDQAGGDVLVADDHLLQRDSWVYQRAKANKAINVPWTGSTRPIFASSTGLASSNLRLIVSSEDQLGFEYDGIRGHCLAFMRRQVLPQELPALSTGRRSPMQDLARSVYLSPGFKVIGETDADVGRWPGVVVRGATP